MPPRKRMILTGLRTYLDDTSAGSAAITSGPLPSANDNPLVIDVQQYMVSYAKSTDAQADYVGTVHERDGRPDVTVICAPLVIGYPSRNGTGKGTVAPKQEQEVFCCHIQRNTRS